MALLPIPGQEAYISGSGWGISLRLKEGAFSLLGKSVKVFHSSALSGISRHLLETGQIFFFFGPNETRDRNGSELIKKYLVETCQGSEHYLGHIHVKDGIKFIRGIEGSLVGSYVENGEEE